MARQRATALLIDLDGVLRVWDPEPAAAAERDHGLPAGSLMAAAMRWGRLKPVLAGEVSHADWLAGIADELAELAGGADRARAAIAQWQQYRGEVDPQVLDLVREVRAAGLRVGLATNATDLLDADLAALKLADEVDVVLNSSALGEIKPSKEYFAAACRALGTLPDRVLLVDDEDRMVRGARVAGLSAYRWDGPAGLRYVRAALELPAG